MDVLKHSIGASEGDSFCSQTVNALQVINIHFNLHCPSFTLQLFYPELLLPPKKKPRYNYAMIAVTTLFTDIHYFDAEVFQSLCTLLPSYRTVWIVSA